MKRMVAHSGVDDAASAAFAAAGAGSAAAEAAAVSSTPTNTFGAILGERFVRDVPVKSKVRWAGGTHALHAVQQEGRGGRVILQEDAGLKARLFEEHVEVI